MDIQEEQKVRHTFMVDTTNDEQAQMIVGACHHPHAVIAVMAPGIGLLVIRDVPGTMTGMSAQERDSLLAVTQSYLVQLAKFMQGEPGTGEIQTT